MSTSTMNQVPNDLELRITAQKLSLNTKLAALKSEAKPETVGERDAIKAKLSLVDHIVKEGVVDGWASIGPNVRAKLETWLVS